jgi:hypothetical protein
MNPAWFANHPDDDPHLDRPHLVCPTCGCSQVNLVGHDFNSQDDDPTLLPERELTIELQGACGHFWMIFFGDFGCETTIDVVGEPKPRHPRHLRRTSTDKRWK